jgi:hypothetical protein
LEYRSAGEMELAGFSGAGVPAVSDVLAGSDGFAAKAIVGISLLKRL